MAPRWARRIGSGVVVGRLALAYAALGLLKHVIPLSVIARWSWREPRQPRDPIVERRYTALAIRARRVWGVTDGDCLQRSLLLYRLLSRAGADPVLLVGFRQSPAGLQGHASVIVDGRLVAETEAEDRPFVPAFRFGRRGAVLSH